MADPQQLNVSQRDSTKSILKGNVQREVFDLNVYRPIKTYWLLLVFSWADRKHAAPPFQKILRFIAFYSDVQSLMHPFLLSDLQHNPFIMRYSPRAAFRVIEKERIDLFHNLLFYCPTPRATLSVLIRLRHLLRTGEGKRKMVVWRGKW